MMAVGGLISIIIGPLDFQGTVACLALLHWGGGRPGSV